MGANFNCYDTFKFWFYVVRLANLEERERDSRVLVPVTVLVLDCLMQNLSARWRALRM